MGRHSGIQNHRKPTGRSKQLRVYKSMLHEQLECGQLVAEVWHLVIQQLQLIIRTDVWTV